MSGVGGEQGPDLTRVGDKDPAQVDFAQVPGGRSFANWNLEHFRSPGAVAAGSQMPVLGLAVIAAFNAYYWFPIRGESPRPRT